MWCWIVHSWFISHGLLLIAASECTLLSLFRTRRVVCRSLNTPNQKLCRLLSNKNINDINVALFWTVTFAQATFYALYQSRYTYFCTENMSRPLHVTVRSSFVGENVFVYSCACFISAKRSAFNSEDQCWAISSSSLFRRPGTERLL